METVNPGGATETPQATPGGGAADTKITYSPEQQAHLDTLIARKEKELFTKWQKENRDALDKAKKFDEWKAQQEQEEAAKRTELENLKLENEKLKSAKSRLDALDSMLAETVEARKAQIPEEKRSLVPVGLSNEVTLKWLDDNWKFLAGVPGSPPAPTSPSPPQNAEVASLEADAATRYETMYADQAKRERWSEDRKKKHREQTIPALIQELKNRKIGGVYRPLQ